MWCEFELIRIIANEYYVVVKEEEKYKALKALLTFLYSNNNKLNIIPYVGFEEGGVYAI